MFELHSLLRGQLKRHSINIESLDSELQKLLEEINRSYFRIDEDKKNLEKTLERRTEENLQDDPDLSIFFQSLPDVYFLLDAEGKILDCKGTPKNGLSKNPKNYIGGNVGDSFPPNVGDLFSEAISNVLHSKNDSHFEFSLTDDNLNHYFEVRCVSSNDNLVIAIVRNISNRKYAEEELVSRSAFLRQVIDVNPNFIFAKDREGRFTLVNKAVVEAYGTSVENMLGRTESEINPHKPELDRLHKDNLKMMESEKGKIVREEMITDVNNSARWMQTTIIPMISQNGNVHQSLGISTDITERKKSEEAIKEMAAFFREVIENASGVPFLLNFGKEIGKGTYTYVGAGINDLLGIAPEEFNEIRFKDLVQEVHPLLPEMPFDPIQCREKMLSGALKQYKADIRIKTSHGDEKWISDCSLPLHDEKTGQVIGAQGILLDITERKRTEHHIRLLNLLKEQLLGAKRLPDKLKLITDSVVKIFDADFCRIWIMGEGDQCEKGCPHAIVKEGPNICRNRTQCLHLQASSGRYTELNGEHFRVPLGCYKIGKIAVGSNAKVITNNLADDQLIHDREWAKSLGLVSFAGFRLLSTDEKPVGVLAFFRNREILPDEEKFLDDLANTTSQVILAGIAEDALRVSENRFHSLFDRMMDGVYRSTHDGRFVDFNPSMMQMFGYESKEEMLNIDIKKDLYFAPDDRDSLFLDKGEEKVEVFRMRKKDGTEIWVEDHGQYVHDEQGNVIFHEGILRDVTDRIRFEEALKVSEERYRKFFEEDITGDYISTPGGELLECNSAFARIFGFASVQEAKESGVGNLFLNFEQKENFLNLLREKKKLEYHESVMKKQDGIPINIVENAIGIFDKKGNLVQIRGYIFDDTKRKLLEQELIQAQKLESIGTLASGIAHDFNNILGIIIGYSHLLRQGPSSGEIALKAADVIDNAAKRGAGLVRQILTFARKTDTTMGMLDLNVLIKEVVKMMNETFPKTIMMKLDLAKNLPSIIADPTQVHQVLLNLCLNARDAMPDGGMLEIKTDRIEGGILNSFFPDADAAQYIHLFISDTGHGMSNEVKNRIFEPFFTTKEKGKGTGLGLAVVYGVVRGHNGFLNVESEPERGSIFHLYFPIPVQNTESPISFEVNDDNILGGNETILIIEDEIMLSDLMRNILEAHGYRVHSAKNGLEALVLFGKHKDSIDLVITDMGLPGISGRDLFIRMKKLKPELKLIFASGFLEPEIKQQMLKDGALEYIQKPYFPPEILKKTREALDKE